MKTNLLERIRTERVQKRRKRPLDNRLYNRIGSIVREHGLEDAFIEELESVIAGRRRMLPRVDQVPEKPPFSPHLFALLAEHEYRIATDILVKVTNPYLDFVHSPEEILFCVPLYESNSTLRPERLSRWHFGTLLLIETAGERMDALIAELEEIASTMVELRTDREGVLKHLSRRIGFFYNPDGYAFMRNLLQRIRLDYVEEEVLRDNGLSMEIRAGILARRYGLGLKTARSILDRDQEAIRESYREDLLEEGRQKLDTLRERIDGLRRLMATVETVETENRRRTDG